MTRETLDKLIGPRVSRSEMAEGRLQFLVPTLLLGAAGLLLVISIFLPYWKMRLLAPQYPGGLEVQAYLNHLEGDVREIDGLNHYIGMRPLGGAAQLERELSIAAVAAIALLAIAAIWIHNQYAALLSLPAAVFPFAFLADLYYWLRNFGTNLDPTAPLSSSIHPFVPPVLGTGKIGQFATVAAPGAGLWLAFAASLLILTGLWFHRRAYKPLVDASRA
ncbi:MAG TPA: cytochrome C [Thermoanaerobaculia bacterium]|nr:cytochrome C [Thermoanaerobaculia bacterium]